MPLHGLYSHRKRNYKQLPFLRHNCKICSNSHSLTTLVYKHGVMTQWFYPHIFVIMRFPSSLQLSSNVLQYMYAVLSLHFIPQNGYHRRLSYRETCEEWIVPVTELHILIHASQEVCWLQLLESWDDTRNIEWSTICLNILFSNIISR